MSGLDDAYTRDIDSAVQRAKADGRFDLAEYFVLRASNDAVRDQGVAWLYDSLTEIVEAFNGHGAGILVERSGSHRFRFGSSMLTGSSITLKKGLRSLSVEAGWTQSTGDGIMRGGALVSAKISHFGFAKHNEELLLLKVEGVPQWFSRSGERELVSFNIRSFKKHFEIFLG